MWCKFRRMYSSRTITSIINTIMEHIGTWILASLTSLMKLVRGTFQVWDTKQGCACLCPDADRESLCV